MSKKKIIIIPARYKSKRFPGKPLAKILKKEMVLRVAQQCINVVGKNNLFVATDNRKIYKKVIDANFKAVMTSEKCLTGTDRVAEAAKKIKSDIYVNVQGDEPLIKANDIKKIISAKIKYPNFVICGYSKLHKTENVSNRNIPKVVINTNDELVYISRAAIPASKKGFNKNSFYNKQVCIYAFNKKELSSFFKIKKKTKLEVVEDIEILRFFELGIKIKMVKLNSKSIAVDEKKDIKIVETFLRK